MVLLMVKFCGYIFWSSEAISKPIRIGRTAARSPMRMPTPPQRSGVQAADRNERLRDKFQTGQVFAVQC